MGAEDTPEMKMAALGRPFSRTRANALLPAVVHRLVEISCDRSAAFQVAVHLDIHQQITLRPPETLSRRGRRAREIAPIAVEAYPVMGHGPATAVEADLDVMPGLRRPAQRIAVHIRSMPVRMTA